MKKIITVLIVVGVACGGWFLYTKKEVVEVQNEGGTSISFPSNMLPSSSPEKSLDTNSQVTRDFNTQSNGAKNFTLEKPVVFSNYAIQDWSDENVGGQALLKHDPSRGWVLITMGGGAWSVEDLVKVGVPKETAKQLLTIKK